LSLEERIDEWSQCRRSGKKQKKADNNKNENDGRHPELLIVFYELPELTNYLQL
jgi:hypothetical protein